MQHVLTFTDEHQGWYALLQDALQIGSTVERQQDPKAVTRDVRRSEATLQRTIRAIGVLPEDDAEPKKDPFGLDVDRRKRKLQPGGGVLRVSHPDFVRLQRYVTLTPWLADYSEQVTELEDWLEAAPQEKDA